MRARALLAASVLAAGAVLAAAATPAQAQLGGCGLTITAPGAAPSQPSAALGSSTVTLPLGQVQVCATVRTLQTTTFTARVKTDGFTTGGGTAPERIAPEKVTYTRGTVGLLPVSLSANACAASAPFVLAATEKTATTCSLTGLVGDATVSWTPTLSIDVSTASVAGTYTGTITHSVA